MRKNLQKRVGKYCFQRFIGRGTIIFQKFFKIMSVFVRPSTEYVKGLMKLKEKMIKMQKISRIFCILQSHLTLVIRGRFGMFLR